MLPNMGFGDWIIVLALILLLFGAKRLPELAKALGQSVGLFKKALHEGESEPVKREERRGRNAKRRKG